MKKEWTRAMERRYNDIRYCEFTGKHPTRFELDWYATVKSLRTEHLFARLFGRNRKGRKARKMWQKQRAVWLAQMEAIQ